jgi:hypothetical protein
MHESVQLVYFSVQGSTFAANTIITHPLIMSAAAHIFVFTLGILHIPPQLVERKVRARSYFRI